MSSETQFTSETAAEAGRKSAEARRRKAELSPAQRAEQAAAEKAPQLIKDLLEAAQGQGDFEGLPKELRLKALFRALEYGLGRPAAARKPASEDDGVGSGQSTELFAPAVVDPRLEDVYGESIGPYPPDTK